MASKIYEVAFQIGAKLSNGFKGAFGQATDQVERLTRAQQSLENTTKSMAKAQALQERGASMASDATGKLARNFGIVAATLGPAVKTAIDFETAMSDVKKVVDFESPKELEAYSNAIQEMSLRIPIAADGLAAIMAAAGQSGIAKADLIEFTEQAAKMGVAFDVSAEQAGEMMAKWKSGMGLTLEDTFELADVANSLSNANAANAAEIGEVLKRYGALAKTAGLNEKQLAAMAATTIAAGAGAETASTGIKAFMRALTKGASMSSAQREAFEGVGLDPEQIQKDLQKDAPKAIMEVLQTVKDTVPPDRLTEILGVMFGDEAAVAIGPMMGNLQALADNFAHVADKEKYAGSMAGEFKAKSETTANALELTKNAALYAAQAFGKPLLEPLKELLPKLVALAEKAGKWVAENQAMVMTGLKVAGVLIGLNSAFHAIRLAIGLLFGPIGQLWKAFLFIKKAFILVKSGMVAAKIIGVIKTAVTALGAALKFAFVTNPWVLAIGAAIAAFTALVYWSKEIKNWWEWLKQKALELWNTFAEKFPFISGLVQTYFGPIVVWARTIIDVFVEVINFFRNIFTGQWGAAWENIQNIFMSIWTGMKDMLRVPLNGIIRMINSALTFSVPDWVPGLGGKSFAVDIPELASGGIARSATPAVIGEGREPEAVLPLSRLDSMLQNAGGGGGQMSVNFAPVINVSGGGGADAYSQVKRGLDEGLEALKRELERIRRNERRLAY